MKLSITGVSGVGKTTLAKYLSETLEIPFVDTSAKSLWPQYGISSHKQLIAKSIIDPVFGLDFQTTLINRRYIQLMDMPSYITDRSLIDNVVYFFSQVSPFLNKATTEDFLALIKKYNQELNSKHIFLAYNDNVYKQNGLEDDGKRVHNHYYQIYMDAVYREAIHQNWAYINQGYSNLLKVEEPDFTHRVNTVMRWLKK